MSLLVHQLNTDNDILYLVGDIVTQFKQETDKNKQKYNGIVDDLNYIFHIVDESRFTMFQLHLFVSKTARPRRSILPVTRLHNLFSGYKYGNRKYNRIRYPIDLGYGDYIGCSYIRTHLADKLHRAIKNYTIFYNIHRYRYETIRNKVCHHKAGIEGWYGCQYKLY